MLTVTLNEQKKVVVLEPNGKLTKADFEAAAIKIDPFIEASGQLNGLIIHVKSFPGWDSFASLIKHLKFIRDHHKKIARLAFVTNSPIGELAEHIASHFINAEIKHFSYSEMEQAENWILDTK
ncbi:MAG: hypothetical protein COA73_04115 [Candidatus Hydrogenedentota bacterium]|nr:MAG: hypothetical protein COA73_04115 [Candidatus Hydrogenedentota bacterium]